MWLKSFRVISNVKVFATQDGGTNKIHYMDPLCTDLDQKCRKEEKITKRKGKKEKLRNKRKNE